MKKKILLYFLVILFFFNLVHGFDISTTYSDKIVVQSLHISQEMLDNDLELDLAMNLFVLTNYTLHRPNITIYFTPYEKIHSLPIKITNITICEGSASSMNYDENFITCGKELEVYQNKTKERREHYVLGGKLYADEYYEYRFTFKPEDNKDYVIRLVGIYHNYAKKQGDLYSVALRYPGREYNNIWNYFVFPSKDSIPQFIPRDLKDIKETIYEENGNYYSKWVFEFDGTEDIVIFYKDYLELQKRDEDLVWLGVKLGFFFSLILLLLELMFGATWRYYLRKEWNKLFGDKTVVGNSRTKKYHIQNCKYIDNIEEMNRKEFKNINEARNKRYSPCKECMKDEI